MSDWKALNSARNPERAALTSICGLALGSAPEAVSARDLLSAFCIDHFP